MNRPAVCRRCDTTRDLDTDPTCPHCVEVDRALDDALDARSGCGALFDDELGPVTL